jgi:imidazolonepropionase
MRKLFRNARIHTFRDTGRPLCGIEEATAITVYDPGAMVVRDGLIEWIGPADEVPQGPFTQTIDLAGRCVLPGFVDPHTHICFAATRENEFRMRLAGADYMQIHREGGGIMSSVRSLRAASRQQVLDRTLVGLERSLQFGVTTVEIKTGYGLSTEAEILQLEVIAEAGRQVPQDVVPTFLGAHSIPEEYRSQRADFVNLVVEEMIPAAAATGIPRYCDVFTEEGVFTVAESERILTCARDLGMELKAHVDEIVNLHGAAMAARLGCVSAEHLIAAEDEGLAAMAAAGTIAVVLPGTSFSLKKPFARAKRMVEMGVPLALATDCNPGSCYTESIPFVVTLAVMQMGVPLEAALAAVTINAAYSIGTAGSTGTLEQGKQGDFVVLDGESPAIICYHVGVNPVAAVYKRGERVV